jgi:hypothetical protein
MSRRFAASCAVALSLLVCAPAGASAPKLSLHLSRSIVNSPGRLVARVTVEKNEDNRALEIVADSPLFYRSSVVNLDGDRAPRVTEVELKNLPGGSYEIVASLYDSRGDRVSARALAEVIPRMGDR